MKPRFHAFSASLLALSFRNDAKVRPEKCEAVFR
jgi:hypothetical protein